MNEPIRNYFAEGNPTEHFLTQKTIWHWLLQLMGLQCFIFLVLPHWEKLQQCCRWCRGSQCHKAQSQGNKSHPAPVSTEGRGSHLKIYNLKRKTTTISFSKLYIVVQPESNNKLVSKGSSGAKGEIITNAWAAKEDDISAQVWDISRASFTCNISHPLKNSHLQTLSYFKAGWESIFIDRVNSTWEMGTAFTTRCAHALLGYD